MVLFFGSVITSIISTISPEVISISNNLTTSTVAASVSGGTGTYSYLWQQSGTMCTINTPTSVSTTFTGSSVNGTTKVYCYITDSKLGTTFSTPVCNITWTTPTGTISQGSPISATSTPCTATLTGATATGYTWARVSGVVCSFSPNGSATTTVSAPGAETGTTTTIQCTISYSGGTVVPTTTITWGLI
jgi:hypothetical protein